MWGEGTRHCNCLHSRHNDLDQDVLFAEVWEEGSVIQIAKVPVTNEKPLDTVAHCSACLEGKILPGRGRNLSKSMMKYTLLTLSIRMYLWETSTEHSSHLQDFEGNKSGVVCLIMKFTLLCGCLALDQDVANEVTFGFYLPS